MTYQVLNRELKPLVRYEEMDNNLGRAAIRNRFLQYVAGDYLLFLDCDAEISKEDFVQCYIDEIQKGRLVVCGSHRYVCSADIDHSLKYRYGCSHEVRNAALRMKDPNRSFMTGNFLISREILSQNRFDERLKKYGHEDTLMGFRLSQQHCSVWHIDNPIDLRDIDSNEMFVQKTRESVSNLADIYGWVDHPNDFAAQVRLLSFYKRLKIWHLTTVVKTIYSLVEKHVEHRLIKGSGSLNAFNFYKIGLLCKVLG